MISIESQGCSQHANVIADLPSSQPSTLPAEYVLIDAGQKAPADGFFITTEGTRRELHIREAETLAYKLQLNEANRKIASANADREAALKEAQRNDWCSRWCLEIGIFTGLLAGGFVGGLIGKNLLH
jgi:hypothetical protein